MRLMSIASGSSGNCIYVGNDNTHILIDTGISKKRVEEGLKQLELSPDDLKGIFITHEHSDHISGLGVLSRKYNVPIYSTRETIKAIKAYESLGRINEELFVEVEPDTSVTIEDLTVRPFSISHDAVNPVGYRVEDKASKIAVATDMGTYNDYIVENLTGLNGLVLEANHDVRMLQTGTYPYSLKQRILGNKGHLCNEMAGRLLDIILNENMKKVFLGHLSKENNYEELAYESVRMEINLKLEELDCSIAIITNAKSKKMGKKDIIKIDKAINLDFDILGYIDPNITIDIIKENQLVNKYHVELPKQIENLIKCKNPRCITSQEQELKHT